MTKFIKYIVILMIIIFVAIPFADSYSVQSIDDLAYLVALGIDVGETNTYTVTFQFTMPTSSGSDSSESSDVITNSVDAASLDSAISLMNTYVSKEINLSHCKIIVISEELATLGISDLMYTLMNKVQIRPSCNIIIAESTSKDYITNVESNLENLIAKFYEISSSSSEYTGYTANIKLGDFFNNLTSNTIEPTAMLGFIDTQDGTYSTNFTTQSSNDNENEDESNSDNNDESENSVSSSSISDTMGLAVFKNDTLIGKLSAEETLYHLLIRNELESCYITIPNTNTSSDNPIDLYVYNESSPKITVQIINSSPYISLEMNLQCKVVSVDSTTINLTEEKLQQISDAAEQYIKENISNYLYKTSNEFNADIIGFGNYALSLFLTTQEFESYNWLENYQNSIFDININANVESALLLSG